MNTSPTSPSYRGAHFAAAATIPVPAKQRAPLVVAHAQIAAVAPKPNAAFLVEKHHSDLFAVATGGVLEAVRTRMRSVEDLVASGQESCRRLATGLAQLQPNRVVPGEDQPRTLSVRLNIAGALALAAGTVACDWLLIRNLASDVAGPEFAANPLALVPVAFPIIAATGAMKLYPLLRHRDAVQRADWERKFARLLPWMLPVLLLAVAKRLAGWSVNPIDSVLGDIDTAHEMALTIGAFMLQLGGMTIIAAAALTCADSLARVTRPSSSQPSEHYLGLKGQLDAEARMLDGNQGYLGGLRAKLAEIEGERAAFLAEAEAALQAEQLELASTARHIAAMRPYRGPSPTSPANGHRFNPSSGTN